MEIIKRDTDFCIEVKRLYLPYIIKENCPKCNEIVELDFSTDQYLSYPDVGKIEIDFHCYKCTHGFNRKFEFIVDLREVKDDSRS